MEKRETGRRNPIAQVTLVLVLVLVVFELLMICGAMELKAQTVAKYAPWAYEPFLRLVGDHPESAPRWAAVEEAAKTTSDDSPVATVAGLQPSAIPVLTETNALSAGTDVAPEPETAAEPETEPAPTNNPPVTKEEIVPVG